ncbi:MAG: tRNA 2-selenouridine(34) synthase MnmH [Ferruginibacter sp.]
MPIQKLLIEDFIQLAKQHPVLDVRSPGEYSHAHIPGAENLALFTDEERAVVGTAYKRQSREQAIKTGLDYFGPKMRGMVETVEKISEVRSTMYNNPSNQISGVHRTSNIVLTHCWRGGMRSAGVAWLLDLYGFKVYTLVGGYKAYRKWVRDQFEKEYAFNIIGGHTGSGKTLVLHELIKQQQPAIDLEALANHKGSAFGAVGKQPTQEMFENLLAQHLSDVSIKMTVKEESAAVISHLSSSIWLEDESQRIGNLQIPIPLWNTMRKSPVYFLDIPFEARLDYITEEYGKNEKEKLVNATIRIQKRLGGLETKNVISHLLEDNHKEAFRILLRYYDKWYQKALFNRENPGGLLNKIPCSGVDTLINTKKITAWPSATV